jgi:hypothetical protein
LEENETALDTITDPFQFHNILKLETHAICLIASVLIRTLITVWGWPFHNVLGLFCVHLYEQQQCWKETRLRSSPLRGLIALLFSSGHCCSEEGCTSVEMREEREAQALLFQAIVCE